MTAKDCGHHDDDRKKLYRRLLAAVLGLIIAVLFIILLVWLILRPTKPHFLLQDATIHVFNLTTPTLLTTTLQVTISSRNPNERIGIYYDKLDIYAAYHGQQITLANLLPASYQGHKDITVWSPLLYGNDVLVAPQLAGSLWQDEVAGRVVVDVRVDGRMRWKVGTFISGKYHLNVNCPAEMSFGNNGGGVASGLAAPIKYQLVMDCTVDV